MEFMGRGCLADVLAEHETIKMTPAQISFIARESLKALAYIHQKGAVFTLSFFLSF
jgi:serine/threonine protein kinase